MSRGLLLGSRYMDWNADDLGDRVLLVGRNCSRSASAKEMGIEMANCIYFTNEYKCEFVNEWEEPCDPSIY